LRPTVSATPRFVPAELTCVCGEVFTQSRWGQKYCIPEHSPSHKRNKMKTARGGRSGWAWQKLRRQVISEESSCWLCGELVDKSLPYPMRASPSVDHVVPVRAGGSQHDRENLRLAHLSCNQRRKNPAYARMTGHGYQDQL
jgi:5-methylcytosine-specific restriction endonuclease McrA